jgi:excisionase family DNA binding protein
MALPDQPPLPFPKSQKLQAQDSLRVDKLLLTPEEAADVLSIGRSKVYELISDGRLPSVRIDASRRVPISALVEFVEHLQEQREPPSLARDRA